MEYPNAVMKMGEVVNKTLHKKVLRKILQSSLTLSCLRNGEQRN